MAQELSQDIKRLQEALLYLDELHYSELKGRSKLSLFKVKSISGWPELAQGKERIDAAFPELFPQSVANKMAFNVTAMTEAYHKYKREYVKHVAFTPEGESLSKYL